MLKIIGVGISVLLLCACANNRADLTPEEQARQTQYVQRVMSESSVDATNTQPVSTPIYTKEFKVEPKLEDNPK